MGKDTDARATGIALHFLPLRTRVPLKFGHETVTDITCARVRMRVQDRRGRTAEGWGETPLGVQWSWPSPLSYEQRHAAMQQFCRRLADAWADFAIMGHPLEVGHAFQEQVLPGLLAAMRPHQSATPEPMPLLAALVCLSAFDLAFHDAYGHLCQRAVYDTYGPEYMSHDLSHYLRDADGASARFAGRYPRDYLVNPRADTLDAWHVVGGLDPLDESELRGTEPNDGYPITLTEWIARDGLKCLKLKLRGNDAAWDYRRIVNVGRIAVAQGVDWLSLDFNCTVDHPDYVNAILDDLLRREPRLFGMVLYIEQPFAYDLEQHPLDVHSVAARKPLFMDESAHDWQLVRRGRELGWSGVALKTCKTQTGAVLSLCWAKAHGMTLTVQDLTNPMLAQIPHVLLAAHAGTVSGLDTNAMQFYPDASAAEAEVHPGLYRRRGGILDLRTIRGAGFGYRLAEIRRALPEPDTTAGTLRGG